MKNWKTTITGIALILLGALFIYLGKVEYAGMCILAGLGFLGAKDFNVTDGTTGQDDRSKDNTLKERNQISKEQ